MNALILTMVIAFLSLLSSVVAAETVYLWLISAAGLGAQMGWISITASQLAFRKEYVAQGGKIEDLKFKTPLYPFLPLLGLILNVTVLVSLSFDPDQRVALYCGIPFMTVCYLYYKLRMKGKDRLAEEDTWKNLRVKTGER
ncbi:Amino-acid permease RocE [compost metagenome]